jgi:hypothetical protein
MSFANKKIWPNDSRIGSKSSSNLLEFFDMDINLKEELEEFEGEFVKRWSCWSVKVQ